MKLEKFKDKSKSKRKVLFISLSVVMLISISLLLYKTFARFTEKVEFPIVNGKVDYFGNSDAYFAFYKKGEPTDIMPEKGNSENLVFDHGECDNGAEVSWKEEEWAPLVKNLSKSKTKCSLYFEEYVPTFDKEVTKCGQGGTAATTCITNNASLDESLIKDDYGNLRYTGYYPDNYVKFNNETWRIIGIIDGKLKIIRRDSIDNMAWDSNSNIWSSSSLANYLNNEYTVGNNSLVVSGSWNVGGSNNYSLTAKEFYKCEQETKWTGKVGLMTASDYGYAVGGSVRETCLGYSLDNYNKENCAENDWINENNSYLSPWTMTMFSATSNLVLYLSNGRLSFNHVGQKCGIFPVVYLNANTRITGGTGKISNPFTLEL